MNHPPLFDVNRDGDVTILQLLQDKYMHDDILDLEFNLRDYLQSQRPRKLLIDMRSLQLSTNAIHRLLLEAKKSVEREGGSFALCNLTPNVHDILQMLHLLGHIFEVYDTTEEAVAALSQRGSGNSSE